MSLKHLGDIELPPHAGPGGFDHAAVHGGRGRLYVAHTANDALDVIDCARRTYTGSIRDLAGVAGALVSEEHDLVFTSNRAENSVGIFSPLQEQAVVKVEVGVRPNGLAYAPAHRLLLVANVGDPSMPQSFTVSMVDVGARRRIDDIPVPGRTRWVMFDHETDSFYVNIADPPQIVVIGATTRGRVTRAFTIPAAGPHGLDLDAASRRLFCACDGRSLVVLDSRSGDVLADAELSGVPDVIFFSSALRRLYVAIGDPGLIEVFETVGLRRVEALATERGAHTLAFDRASNTVYAFLPATHRAAVYQDGG
jgi:DNA-binding beta-propeller fold protein YncE